MKTKIDAMSDKEKAAHFGRMIWEELPIIAEVREVLDLAQLAKGTGLSGKVSLIHGANGVGKSVACDHYFRVAAGQTRGTYVGTNTPFAEEDSILDATWVSTVAGNKERRSMIKIDVSPRVTANGLLADAFRGLNSADVSSSARHDVLLRNIKKILRGLGTDVLVLDNAHHAVEARISVGNSAPGDIIAHIAEQTGVEIVLLGTDLALSLFTGSRNLNNIKGVIRSVGAIESPTAASRDFRTLLERFEKRLPFPRRSDLTSDGVATRLFTFCEGNVEKLQIFLHFTVLICLNDKAEYVDRGTLAAAYDRLYSSAGTNPFRGSAATQDVAANNAVRA